MLKICPLHPDTNTTLIGGRGIDCPNQPCKFNHGKTCLLMHGAAVALENNVLLGKIAKALRVS